jgi:hypothetical protein
MGPRALSGSFTFWLSPFGTASGQHMVISVRIRK